MGPPLVQSPLKCGFLKKSFIMNAPLVRCPFPVFTFGWVQQQKKDAHPSIQWTKFTSKLLMCTGACCLLGRVFTDSAGKITIFISSSALVPLRLWSLKIISKIAQLCTRNTSLNHAKLYDSVNDLYYSIMCLEEVSGSENCRGSRWNEAFESPIAQLIISVRDFP